MKFSIWQQLLPIKAEGKDYFVPNLEMVGATEANTPKEAIA